MASFKTHFSVGVLLGLIGCGLSFIFLMQNQYLSNFLIILFIVVGSVLPDLDSDESRPFKIVFSFFSFLGALSVFFFIYFNELLTWPQNLMASILTIFFIRFVIGSIFKRFTHHRGIFHSIPMAVIFGLLSFLLLINIKINLSLDKITVLSFCLFLGYFLHLVLDEIQSGINFNGIFYQPKKSLGTALKLFSNSLTVSLAVYLFLFFLLFWLKAQLDFSILESIFK